MQDAQQRGLAAAARPDDRNELAGRDLEADVAQHLEIVAPAFACERLADSVDTQQCCYQVPEFAASQVGSCFVAGMKMTTDCAHRSCMRDGSMSTLTFVGPRCRRLWAITAYFNPMHYRRKRCQL